MGGKGSKPTEAMAVWGPEGEEEAKLGVSPILRNVKAPFPLATAMSNGNSTSWEMAEHAVKTYPSSNALGTRTILKRDMVPSADGKKHFEKLTLSAEYSWLTYAEFGKQVERLASSLVKLAGMKKGDRVLIFAETQAEWMVTMQACFRQGVTVVTAYATLGEEGVTTSLNQSGATICVCDAKLFKTVENCAKNCPGLKFVVPILTPADPITVDEMQKALGEKIQVRSTKQLVDECSEVVAATPPAPKDLAVLMYTSGTTGASKGVMISHENIAAQSASTILTMPFVDNTSVYLAYLPLAHIMELFIECSLLYVGASIGYGSPHTLTNTGVKLAVGQSGDAPLLRPTLLVFAPAVVDKIYAAVKDKVAKGGGMQQKLFNSALAAGYKNYEEGRVGCGPLGNALMAKAVQSLVGGRVTHIVTGSAPLSAEIQKFAQSCFNCPVRQGYGLTETTAASTLGDFGDNTLGQVGPPSPGTYLRLRDWPEGGYTNGDLQRPDIGMRRGEVLLGGPTVAQGYLVDAAKPDPDIQKKNEEDFITIDGIPYFCSGDIGQISKTGCLSIVDRKKDLFKGANGEYVSLSKVEAFIKLSTFVEIPMVYGRTGAAGVIALICPKKFAIEESAKKKGITGLSFADLCKNKDIVDEVTQSVLKECKAGGLNAFEIPTAVALCGSPDGLPAWSPDNDLLTTTLKLKRPAIVKAQAAEIDDAYARSK